MEILAPISTKQGSGPRQSMPQLDRLLSLHDVKRVTSLSKTSIYRGIAAGRFPAPMPIADQRVAWAASDILQWQQQCRRKARRSPKCTEVAAA